MTFLSMIKTKSENDIGKPVCVVGVGSLNGFYIAVNRYLSAGNATNATRIAGRYRTYRNRILDRLCNSTNCLGAYQRPLRKKDAVGDWIDFIYHRSVGCAFSQTIGQILVARVVQALGACVGPMLSRAMVRDMFDSKKAAEMLSTLMILMALAPIFGPLIGGQMLTFTSWQSIFWLLAIIGGVMLISLKKLPETLPEENRQSTSLWNAFKKYGVLLRNRRFMAYTLCVSFFYVGVYAFVAGSPEIYITYFGVEPQHYGWLFALNVFGIVSLSFANRILVRKFSLDLLLRVATAIAMVAGLVLVVLVKLQIGGIYGVVVPVFFFFSMNGIIAATTTAAALDKVPEMAGAAAALLGSLQYGSGILSTLLLTIFGDSDGSPWTMSWIIALFGVASAGTVLARSFFGILPVEIKRTSHENRKPFTINRTGWGSNKD